MNETTVNDATIMATRWIVIEDFNKCDSCWSENNSSSVNKSVQLGVEAQLWHVPKERAPPLVHHSQVSNSPAHKIFFVFI